MSDNPSAFPVAEIRGPDGCGIREGSDGMTLRDWFAGMAAAQIAQVTLGHQRPFLDPEKVAAAAYALATAMLAEREK